MITLENLENGNLKIILDNKEEFLDSYPTLQPDISTLLDDSRYLGNNWWDLTGAEGFLTESPIIGYDISIDDDGKFEYHEESKIWWFPNYMVENPFETLVNEGFVIFTSNEN